ncbi:MAG: ATPase, T2SS/T4P/T4SS family [Patescibacteria group bacterium]
MPRKILNKIIRHLDTGELAGFTLDRQSGELCYLSKEKGKTLKIPDALAKDFFSAVEKALASNSDGKKLFRLFGPRGKISISLDCQGENGGKKITAEIEKPERLINFKQLGFNLNQQKLVKAALKKKKGLIVAGIPAGNGLSNLIYSLSKEINFEERSAYLLSAVQEHQIDGLNFIKLEYPFEEDLRKKLSWLEKKDAEVIIVPEIYERQTALELARLANTGHLIITGCRSRDTFSALHSFLKSGPTREIFTSFSLVISGRRVHRLCPNCVEKYHTSNEEISAFAKRFAWHKKIAETLIPKKLLRSVGCSKCQYHGNLEKIGLYEILSFDRELKNLADIQEIRREAFHKGYQPLIINALAMAKNGIISLQEILSIKL